MKVYVVMTGCYDAYGLAGVYRTRKGAEAACKATRWVPEGTSGLGADQVETTWRGQTDDQAYQKVGGFTDEEIHEVELQETNA